MVSTGDSGSAESDGSAFLVLEMEGSSMNLTVLSSSLFRSVSDFLDRVCAVADRTCDDLVVRLSLEVSLDEEVGRGVRTIGSGEPPW